MYIMYVDDSGTTSYKDQSELYILSGVIVHKNNVKHIKNAICQYKIDNFVEKYIDAEIHTHDIFKSREEFTNISKEIKYDLLDKLYDTIANMNITTISVIIRKELFKNEYPTWDIFNTTLIYLVERYDKYIECSDKTDEGGIIKIDKSTSKQQKVAFDTVNGLRKRGSIWQDINHIIKDPIFVNSAGVEGIQIADAIAYCTFKHKTGTEKFNPYWNKIYNKFRKGEQNKVNGFGIKEFP